MTERETRTQWFTEARFGMFIHWGLYAIPGRGEWYMSEASRTGAGTQRKMAASMRIFWKTPSGRWR